MAEAIRLCSLLTRRLISRLASGVKTCCYRSLWERVDGVGDVNLGGAWALDRRRGTGTVHRQVEGMLSHIRYLHLHIINNTEPFILNQVLILDMVVFGSASTA